jgi:hypothetical protein
MYCSISPLLLVLSLALLSPLVTALAVPRALKHRLVSACEQFDKGTAAKDDVMGIVTELESLNQVKEPMLRPELLDGTWLTIYTSLKVVQAATSLAALTYGALPIPGVEVNVKKIYQMLDCGRGFYDNLVEFETTASPARVGALSTLGSFTGDAVKQGRLQVVFSDMHLHPLSRDPRVIAVCPELQASLGIQPDQPLQSPLKLDCYVDVSYLDEDGDLRLMRGNAGNLYVLQRTTR